MHTSATRGAVVLEIAVALVTFVSSLYLALRHVAQDGGIATVHDHQLAVFADHLGHDLQNIERPGVQTFLPWFQEVYCLDRRPVEYIMAGSQRLDANHVPLLVVRGREGTCFSFERVEVLYALAPEAATRALLDSGPDNGFKQGLVDAYARGALRAAFGRLTPAEVLLSNAKQAATLAAKEDLERSLERHGLTVLEVSVSKPKFSAKYEQTISRRKVADQDVFKINVERTQMLAGRPAILEQVRGQKKLELERMRETLQSAIQKAQRDQELARYEADRKQADRTQAAGMALEKATAQAQAQRVAVELSTAALQDAQQQLHASQAASLAQRRRELDLQQTREGAERQAALVQVRQEILQAQQAARSSKLATVLEAHLQLKADQSRAQVLSEVAQLDAQGFRARTEAFATDGVAAVRAALVQKLTGISFVIAPPPQNPASNPAQTSAYSEPIQ
jgi:hypothetical protein